jgi:hypothetical protein
VPFSAGGDKRSSNLPADGVAIPWYCSSIHFAVSEPMSTPAISIVFFLVASFLGALGQYLYKSGADLAGGSVASYLLNVRLLFGMLCYVGVMVLFVAAFKKGGSLTVLYPTYATTFIWAALIALLVYGTPIKPINAAGMGLLITGMYLMGK